jgi:hypothetical protein
MQLRLLLSISLLALASQKICAQSQSADDFFHGGARAYLTNNTAGAREQVDQGLKLFPDDIKLKKLDELLKQQQQQQNQQQNQSQKDQSQSKQDQQKSEQQKKDQEKKDQEKKDQQPKPDQQPEQDKDKDKDQQKEQQAAPGQMTPEQAKQLLDSQKADEALLPASQKDKQQDHRHLKDW